MDRTALLALLAATRTESLRTGRGALINWDVTADGGVELDLHAEATDPDDTEIVMTLSRDEALALVQGLTAALLA